MKILTASDVKEYFSKYGKMSKESDVKDYLDEIGDEADEAEEVQARDTESFIEKDIETKIDKIKKDFDEAKRTGASDYLERYKALMQKEKAAFVGEKHLIQASMNHLRDNPEIVREDLLLRVLKALKLGGTRAGANTIKFLGGEMVRKFEGGLYSYTGNDTALEARILKKYGKEQHDQDMKKLKALTLYFDRSLVALDIAIQVRDGEVPPDKKPIQLGAYKLGDSGIKTFSQLPGVTCPGKGDCFNWCFALSGHTSMPNVGIKSYAKNLGTAERGDFEARVNKQLQGMNTRSQGTINFNGKHFNNIIRIHAYGDFHTPKYVKKWKRIAEENPDVFFYAYTKSFYMKPVKQWMQDIKSGKVKNVKIIQSYGSKFDDKIDDSIPHAKVFDNLEGLTKAGYINCENDDMVAADPANNNIGIVKHGNTPCSASMCPFSKTTASTCNRNSKIPIIHLGDQIDIHHNMAAHDLEALSPLEPHLTSEEHGRGFGKHFERPNFRNQVASKYLFLRHC